MTKKDINILYSSGFGILIILIILYLFKLIDIAQAIQIILTFALVSVTTVYVRRTAEIAKATNKQAEATKQQADASIRMAEEMREQRIMASRPVIIQKQVVETETKLRTAGSRDWFSYFEVYNAGNGPATELEVSLLDKDKNQLASHRTTFLRPGDSPICWPDPFDTEFSFDLASRDESAYYFVSEYQGTFSAGPPVKWYQTWLPFKTIKTSQEGKIFVQPGQLEFKEVTEKDRIDAFGSRSKPK